MCCDVFAQVPLEVSLLILDCGILNLADLGTMAQVCKRWHAIVSHQATWRQYAKRLGLLPPPSHPCTLPPTTPPRSAWMFEAAAERTIGQDAVRAEVVASRSWQRLVQEAVAIADRQGYDYIGRDGGARWRHMPRAVVSHVLDPLNWASARPEAQDVADQILNTSGVKFGSELSEQPKLSNKPCCVFPDDVGLFSIDWNIEGGPRAQDRSGYVLFTVDLPRQKLLWASSCLGERQQIDNSRGIWAVAQDPTCPDVVLIQESDSERSTQTLVHVFRAAWLDPTTATSRSSRTSPHSSPRGQLEKVGTLSAVGSFVAHEVEEYDRIRLVYPYAAGFTWTPPALVVWDVSTCKIKRAIDLKPLFEGHHGAPSLRALGARDGNDFLLDPETNSIYFLLIFSDAAGLQRFPIDPDLEGGDMAAKTTALLFGPSTGESHHSRYAALGTFHPFEAYRVNHTFASAADPAELQPDPAAQLAPAGHKTLYPQYQTATMQHDRSTGMLVIAMEEQLLLVSDRWLHRILQLPGLVPQHDLPAPPGPVVLFMDEFPGRWDVASRFRLQPMRGQLSVHGGKALWGPNTLFDYACINAMDILATFLDVAHKWHPWTPANTDARMKDDDLSQYLQHQHEMIRTTSRYPARCFGVQLTSSAAFVLCSSSLDWDSDTGSSDNSQDEDHNGHEREHWSVPSRGNLRAESLPPPRHFDERFASCVIRVDFDASRRLLTTLSPSKRVLGLWADHDAYSRAYPATSE